MDFTLASDNTEEFDYGPLPRESCYGLKEKARLRVSDFCSLGLGDQTSWASVEILLVITYRSADRQYRAPAHCTSPHREKKGKSM